MSAAPTSEEEDRHAWERPGAFEVAPGVHRIPLPLPNDGLKAVNVYAISDGDHVVCIDGGWAIEEAGTLFGAALKTIGYELGDVRDFLVTHLHRDHYTNAVAVRREHGSRVSVGEGERACLDLIRAGDRTPDIDRLVEAGAPELAAALSGVEIPRDDNWEDPDRWLPDAVDLPLETRTLRAINTPGHTIGHLVFHDPAHNVLFAGDHVLPHITPSIGVELNRRPSPLRDYLASLELVRAMPDARLLPAHGPATDSVHARVDELLQHHADRLADTLSAVEAGAHTAWEVGCALPWTRRRHRLPDMDVFNQVLAVNETMAHLRVLAERGRLRETRAGSVAQFTTS